MSTFVIPPVALPEFWSIWTATVEENLDKLWKKQNPKVTFDILDTEKSKQDKLIAARERCRCMIIGRLWQISIGNWKHFEDLRVGHESGLDFRSCELKLGGEIKNRTNTDNQSSEKANSEKLAKFKKENPDYRVIYGKINEDTEEKTIRGSSKTKMVDGVEIEIQTGMVFLRNVFGDHTEIVIEFLKTAIDKYYV